MKTPKREPPAGFRWLLPSETQQAQDVFFDGQEWKNTLRHNIGHTVEYPFIYARRIE